MGTSFNMGNTFVPPYNLNWNNSGGWNNNFGFGNGIGWNSGWSTPSTGSSGSSKAKKETVEEYEARLEEEKRTRMQKRGELTAQKKELQQQLDLVMAQQEALKGETKADGSVEIQGTIQADGTIKKEEEKLENMSTGSKILRGIGNFFSGIGNVCKSIVGIDSKTGKWNPLKCLKNVAIAVGVAVLCVYAAPLGAALAASLGSGAAATAAGAAVAAVPTALGYAGLASGAYMAGKGVYNMAKAETIEEFDQGGQELGAGAFIGISSAMGLRSATKAAGVASSSDGTLASSAVTGLKNVFVNPWKASMQNYKWATEGYITARGSGLGIRRSLQLSKNNISAEHAEIADANFNANYDKVQSQIKSKIRKLQAKKRTASPKEKALLEYEVKGLKAQLAKFKGNPTTKGQWKDFDGAYKDISKDISSHRSDFGYFKKNETEICGETFTSSDKSMLTGTLKSIKKSHKAIDKQMSALKAERFSSMRKLASAGDLAHNRATDFGFSNKWYSGIFNWAESKYYGFSLPKTTTGKLGMAANGAFYITEPAWAVQGLAKNPAMAPLHGMYAYDPVLEKSESATTVIPAAEYAQVTQTYKDQVAQLKQAIGDVDREIART